MSADNEYYDDLDGEMEEDGMMEEGDEAPETLEGGAKRKVRIGAKKKTHKAKPAASKAVAAAVASVKAATTKLAKDAKKPASKKPAAKAKKVKADAKAVVAAAEKVVAVESKALSGKALKANRAAHLAKTHVPLLKRTGIKSGKRGVYAPRGRIAKRAPHSGNHQAATTRRRKPKRTMKSYIKGFINKDVPSGGNTIQVSKKAAQTLDDIFANLRNMLMDRANDMNHMKKRTINADSIYDAWRMLPGSTQSSHNTLQGRINNVVGHYNTKHGAKAGSGYVGQN
jgi:hypothetical protein